ncbi:MAG: HDOD domain-containing protein [Chitinivibrionales bacterium]|nr:HDOD domain-containing protein [Chitinivibrionales bacterium]
MFFSSMYVADQGASPMPFTVEDIDKKVDQNIPSLSPTAAKVMELANDINCPPGELTKVIKLDPVLTAQVLKLVNSSYLSLSNKIVSLEKAIILLGLNTIKNLALGAAALNQMEASSTSESFDNNGFWQHSLAVGVTSKLIALRRGVDKKIIEDYFIAGLLHDLGLVLESKIFHDEIERVILTATEVGIIEAEDIIFEGLNHCKIGAVLGKKWNLSEDLLNVILYHHSPFENNPSELTSTVYLANSICKNSGTGLVMDKTPVDIDPQIFTKLGISNTIESSVLESLEGEIQKAKEFMKA